MNLNKLSYIEILSVFEENKDIIIFFMFEKELITFNQFQKFKKNKDEDVIKSCKTILHIMVLKEIIDTMINK